MKTLSLKALFSNLILAFLFAVPLSAYANINPVITAFAITSVSTGIQYFSPGLFSGKLMEGLQTEVWIPGIKENPLPDMSFINQSVDMSEFVENNTLHLEEAGVDPDVHEDYFSTNTGELPVQSIEDIPNEVQLKIYSTSQTRHNDLLELELQYDKKASVTNRHRNSLAKNMAARTAYSWAAATDDEFNKIINLGATDSVIDGIIDMQAFMRKHDLDLSKMNILLNADHAARIRKEDKKLYKEINSEKGATLYDFRIFFYSKTPYYTNAGVKKPWASTVGATDKQSSVIWSSEEVFRCFGDVEMYYTLKHPGYQADILSFGHRALTGKIRANNPKYLGAIL